MKTDGELLAQWRDGDELASKTLLSRHLESLYRFFATKVSRDIDDLIQETLIGVVEGLPRFRNEAGFRTYLFAIARRRLLRRFRWHQRHGVRFDPLQTSVGELATSPSGHAARKQEHDHVVTAMQTLPVDLQIILELHYWEQMTTAQIADVLETPAGTVRGRLQRARAALEKSLQASGHTSVANSARDPIGELITSRANTVERGPAEDGRAGST